MSISKKNLVISNMDMWFACASQRGGFCHCWDPFLSWACHLGIWCSNLTGQLLKENSVRWKEEITKHLFGQVLTFLTKQAKHCPTVRTLVSGISKNILRSTTALHKSMRAANT